MKNYSAKSLQFLMVFLIGHVSFTNSNSNSASDTRSKTAPEPVEANKVESPPAVARTPSTPFNCSDPQGDSIDHCPTIISSASSSLHCSALPAHCLSCNFNCSCVYGERLNVTCKPKPGVHCQPSVEGGANDVVRAMTCQYCYQTPTWQHSCSGYSKCSSVDTPRQLYSSNCTVAPDIVCLGRRSFLKRRPCNWTAGYHWATALILSLTLGGFGADRFYLGHWQEGIGKLFSFGGLGVWTIMDVILIAIRYLGPADGSLYI